MYASTACPSVSKAFASYAAVRFDHSKVVRASVDRARDRVEVPGTRGPRPLASDRRSRESPEPRVHLVIGRARIQPIHVGRVVIVDGHRARIDLRRCRDLHRDAAVDRVGRDSRGALPATVRACERDRNHEHRACTARHHRSRAYRT
jgi:hypothetical protein